MSTLDSLSQRGQYFGPVMNADHIGTRTAAELLGVSTRTVKRQAGDNTTDLYLAVVTRVDGDGPFVFDRSKVLALRDARIAADRDRLTSREQAAAS